jgi:hypothetical protein
MAVTGDLIDQVTSRLSVTVDEVTRTLKLFFQKIVIRSLIDGDFL